MRSAGPPPATRAASWARLLVERLRRNLRTVLDVREPGLEDGTAFGVDLEAQREAVLEIGRDAVARTSLVAGVDLDDLALAAATVSRPVTTTS